MYIKRLEIDNFKSFANKVEIPFLPGFTAIAGMNGSGKSNIIDSILFALGLSSARALRSEKGVADLISTHNNRNEATVKVVFDLDDDIGTEISFARRVKKSPSGYTSTYYLNDKTVTLTQMHSELEKYSITPNSYNVIMQGDVVSLVNCSSMEKRKFIDEVAGTADFDRKIEAATNELQAVEGRVQDSLLVMNEINSMLEKLQEEREVALKYQEIKNQKDELEGQITAVKYFNFKKTLELMHENILRATKDKKKQEIEVENKQEEINKKREEYEDVCAKVKAQGEDKQLEVKKLVEEKKSEIQRKKDSIFHTEKVINSNNKTIYAAKNAIEGFNINIEKAKVVIAEKEQAKAELEKTLEAKKEELTRILSEVTGLNQTADTYIQKRNALRKELDTLKDDENNLIKDKLPNESKLENLNTELSNTNKAIEELENRVKNFDDDKDKLSLQVETLTKELDDLKTLQKLVFDDIDKTKAQIQDDMRSIQLANKKIAELEANKRAFRTFGLGAGVETIMQSKIQGVHAPLSQLADVDSEYTYAINEALGGRSRFIVVEDENVASRALEVLKSQGKDRATCLPLNKLKPVPNNLPLPKLDGVIDFAINLIDFDDKYIKAFYFALGETLVVESMQAAKKLMGKYRVVTLDGEIFEKSGAITGGAKRKNTPAFGKADDKELENYKSRLDELEEAYRTRENKRVELEKKFERIRADYSNALNSLQAAKYEYSQLLKGHEQFEQIIEEKLKRVNEITPEIKKTEALLDKFEQKHVEIIDKITTIQTDIEEVEKFIDDGELKKLQEMTQGVENEIKELERKILSTENEILKDNQTVAFNTDMIELKESDIKKLSADNIQLNEDKQKFEVDIVEISKVLEELEAQVVELGKNLVELQNLRQKIQDEMLEAQNAKNILENDIERIKESIESFKLSRSSVEPQLEEVIAELKERGIKTEELTPTEISIEEITGKIQKLQKKMDDLGLVNMKAIEDYNVVLNRQKELNTKIETLENEKNEIQSRMTGYENLKKETFLDTFNSVNSHFKIIFTELTDGQGELILENPENPFLGGLTVEGNQKNKEKQKLAGMSGGEKTLMALSLVFAVQRHLPAPFYALDEVDAALDGFNVERIAKMINTQSERTQFVVISQRSQMIESADRMIGVNQNKGRTLVSGITNKQSA